MRPAHPAVLIAFTLALFLAAATGSAGAAGEGSPAIPLGPGAIVQDLQKESEYFTNSWTVASASVRWESAL